MKSVWILLLGITASLAAADLSGIVVAEHDGTPVAGALVTLSRAGQVIAEFDSDESGEFKGSGIPAGEYVVAAKKAGYTEAERRVALNESGADVFLQITKMGVIAGRITDNQGNGVRNMVVAVVPVPSDGSPIRVYNSRPQGAATDSRGNYRVFGLPAGDYAVVALAGNPRTTAAVTNGLVADTSHGHTAEYYPSGKEPVVLSIRSGEEYTNIDFTGYSGPLFAIRGTVIGPAPETPYRVTLVAEGVGVPVDGAVVQPGEEFQFPRVAPGTYKIVAARQISRGIQDLINSGQLVISSATEAELLAAIETARVADARAAETIGPAFGETTVTVVSQDLTGVTLSTRPGMDAKLLYQPADGCPTSVQLALDPIEYLGTGGSRHTLEVGEAMPLTGIPVTAYGVLFDLPESSGCYGATSTIDFHQISSDTTVPVVVAKMGGIRGDVDTTGYLSEEFTVSLSNSDGIAQQKLSLANDSSFSIPNVLPGRYRLSVTRRSASRVVAADQDLIVESGVTTQVDFGVLP